MEVAAPALPVRQAGLAEQPHVPPPQHHGEVGFECEQCCSDTKQLKYKFTLKIVRGMGSIP